MNAHELIVDCVERMSVALKEGRFSKEQLELMRKVLQAALDATNKTIEKANRKG